MSKERMLKEMDKGRILLPVIIEVGKMSEEKVFCPLLNRECLKEKCAWYIKDRGCAIKLLSENIDDLAYLYAEDNDLLGELDYKHELIDENPGGEQ